MIAISHNNLQQVNQGIIGKRVLWVVAIRCDVLPVSVPKLATLYNMKTRYKTLDELGKEEVFL